MISSALDFIGGERANSTARDISDKQMEFQKEMRETQHQTAVEDLKKAGLNPILSATYGGAGTPMGSSYVPQNTLKGVGNTFFSALEKQESVKNLREQNNLLKEQVKKTAAETRATAADTRILSARAEKEERTKGLYGLLPTDEGIKSSARDMVDFYKGDSPYSPRGLFKHYKELLGGK